MTRDSLTQTHAQYLLRYRERILFEYATGAIDERTSEFMREISRFMERTQTRYLSPEHVVDLWGFGDAPARFVPFDGSQGWWVAVEDLAGPLGIDDDTLYEAWDYEHEGGRYDTAQIDCHDGRYVLLVNEHAVMRLFSAYSPWAAEFIANLAPGIALDLAERGQYEPGETRPLPTREQATARAYAGPAGALSSMGGAA